MDFVVDEAVSVTVDRWVHAERENVLVMDSEHARVNDSSPGYFDTFVDGLSADDSGCSDFVGQLAGLIEHEGHDVFIVSDRDDGLDDKLPTSHDSCSTGPVVSVLPANASVLLMDTDYIFHGHWLSFIGCQDSVQIVDRAKAVAAEFQIVRHDAYSDVAQIKGRFFMKWCSRITVGDVHIRECQAVE